MRLNLSRISTFTILIFLSTITLNAQSVKVMTNNIRLDLDSDGANSWTNRKEFFLDQLQFYEPDIIGFQEVLPRQLSDISSSLKAYSFVGVGRDENNQGESSNIFFKKDRYKPEKSGTFWLSETPDKVSKGWDAAINRVCSYVLLFDKSSKKRFWVFNTHLDHIGEEARTNSILLILRKMKDLNKGQFPVILMGDFNSEPDTEMIKMLRTEMWDSELHSLSKPFGPEGTFNGFKHNEPVTKKIDYIFLSPDSRFKVEKYAVLSDSKDLKYPSDHLPVYIELR
jgi:endonuclease/exonuclease/phosphatase family metal-dependent hydrolase